MSQSGSSLTRERELLVVVGVGGGSVEEHRDDPPSPGGEEASRKEDLKWHSISSNTPKYHSTT